MILSFALLAAPYLGGTDFGIIKIPVFSESINSILRFIGLILFLIFICFIFIYKKEEVKAILFPVKSVDSESKYNKKRITEIMQSEAVNNGVPFNNLEINDDFNFNDLVHVLSTWYPGKLKEEIHTILYKARSKAFEEKYAEPDLKYDEKLVNVLTIRRRGLKTWETYLTPLLNDLRDKEFRNMVILDVGIGNGHAEEPLLSNYKFTGVDISKKALDNARVKCPQMTTCLCSAENLESIPTNSIDLYISLRVYQSTLFDQRAALHEAYRVLKNGGIIVLSVPIMFLGKNNEALKGLIHHGSHEPSMNYANKIAEKLLAYLITLNFKNAKIDSRSPFELYIYAKR